MACPLCGGTRNRLEFRKRRSSYYRCLCRHVFAHPLPTAEEEKAHYRASFTPGYLAGVKEWFTVLARRRMDLLESVWKREQKGIILDAGCGYGFFLHEALLRGWSCLGIEAADGPAEFAQKEFGLALLRGDLLERMKELEDASLSFITLWHVLEHVRFPSDLLQVATSKLEPGGLLVVNSPNLDSAIYKLAGRHWSWIYTPGHLQYFSTCSLQSFLNRIGLKAVAVETWTDAPNLIFLLEEAGLHALCDLLTHLNWPSVRRLTSKLRGALYGSFHQQRVQAFWKEIYIRIPGLDQYLRDKLLGHEFVVIVEKDA